MFGGLNEQPLRDDGRCEMAVMDGTGDTKIIWDPNNADEVAAAKASFDSLKAKGFAAHKVEGPKGEQGELIREFDPKAGRIIMVPQFQGG
jgi:ssDNA-binding replication factor A large subunit